MQIMSKWHLLHILLILQLGLCHLVVVSLQNWLQLLLDKVDSFVLQVLTIISICVIESLKVSMT